MTWERRHHFVVSSCFGKLYSDCDPVFVAEFPRQTACLSICLRVCSYLVIHLSVHLPGLGCMYIHLIQGHFSLCLTKLSLETLFIYTPLLTETSSGQKDTIIYHTNNGNAT